LLDVGRTLFAEKGFQAASIEEIAARAGVSKPVVYEHFGGKEGLYAVVVDREMGGLLDRLTSALSAGHPRALVEQAALALLTYIEEQTDGFRILSRDSPVGTRPAGGTFSSLLNDIASQVEHILSREFSRRGLSTKLAPMYAQMLVGMVALTGQWWLEERKPKREVVAAHLVNLGWNGLAHLDPDPKLITGRRDS
jgi:AcrR family transcriptional regulator